MYCRCSLIPSALWQLSSSCCNCYKIQGKSTHSQHWGQTQTQTPTQTQLATAFS